MTADPCPDGDRSGVLAAHGWTTRRFYVDGRTVDRWYGPARTDHTDPGLPLDAAWAAHTAATEHDGYATKETDGS